MATGLSWSKEDALASYLFALEIDGLTIAQCSEVSGLVQEVETIQLYENNAKGQLVLHLLPGKPKAVSITMKRFSSSSLDMADWFKEVQQGDVSKARRNGSIVVYDYNRNSEVGRWNFTGAWPSKITHGGTMKADANTLLTEEVVLQCEHLERKK